MLVEPVELLVQQLLELEPADDRCNIYRPSSDLDNPFATTAEQRLVQLRDHLRQTASSRVIFVGEAVGWRGARQSGVAFTSAPDVELPGTREVTASVVRRTLQSLTLLPQVRFWNALPLHPFHSGRPSTNRTPAAAEVAMGRDSLRTAIGDRQVVCVGATAAAAAAVHAATGIRPVSPDVPRVGKVPVLVRHPSFGGARLFRDQVMSWAQAYHLQAESTPH